MVGLAVLSGCAATTAPVPSATHAAPTAPLPTATHAAGVVPCGVSAAPRTVEYSSLAGGSFTRAVATVRGRAVRIGTATVAFDDFTAAGGTIDGGVLGGQASGLIGAGPAKTVLEVAARTSTHAGDIPAAFPDTNQLSVLRVGGTRTVLRDFTIQGTDQGHLYNGLRVDHARDLRASWIRVVAIPGDAAAPPGETFGVNDYRTTGSQWSHVTVEGDGVGASGFGVNDSTDIRICDTSSEHNASGMGFAFWQSSGITCVDCRAIGNGRAGFNFERVTGSNRLVRPVATGNAYGVRISNDLGSGRFTIVDPPLTDGHFTVTLPWRYNGAPNRQRTKDITLIVDGSSRPDLLRIERY